MASSSSSSSLAKAQYLSGEVYNITPLRAISPSSDSVEELVSGISMTPSVSSSLAAAAGAGGEQSGAPADRVVYPIRALPPPVGGVDIFPPGFVETTTLSQGRDNVPYSHTWKGMYSLSHSSSCTLEYLEELKECYELPLSVVCSLGKPGEHMSRTTRKRGICDQSFCYSLDIITNTSFCYLFFSVTNVRIICDWTPLIE